MSRIYQSIFKINNALGHKKYACHAIDPSTDMIQIRECLNSCLYGALNKYKNTPHV